MADYLNLTNKRIMIAGVATGIGKTTAILLSELGADLILLDINVKELNETMALLKPGQHFSFPVDLSDILNIEKKVNGIIDISGSLDGFVYCVGIRSRRPLRMITPKVLSEVINLNFGAFLELTRCITKKNNFNSELSIVGISSIAASRGGAGVTAYAASKGAMESAVRCLAKEMAPKKIRINTVVPAQTNTPAYTALQNMAAADEDAILARQYLGLGEPLDVANVIAFLLSANSRLITGSAIPVDGGFLTS
ncbi:MAG: SDR family oxidoreductase [Prolixibacteraceae bacterium]|nr:SDR family oxidoreductase [Prolixibacteraceae bacterium]